MLSIFLHYLLTILLLVGFSVMKPPGKVLRCAFSNTLLHKSRLKKLRKITMYLLYCERYTYNHKFKTLKMKYEC